MPPCAKPLHSRNISQGKSPSPEVLTPPSLYANARAKAQCKAVQGERQQALSSSGRWVPWAFCRTLVAPPPSSDCRGGAVAVGMHGASGLWALRGGLPVLRPLFCNGRVYAASKNAIMGVGLTAAIPIAAAPRLHSPGRAQRREAQLGRGEWSQLHGPAGKKP